MMCFEGWVASAEDCYHKGSEIQCKVSDVTISKCPLFIPEELEQRKLHELKCILVEGTYRVRRISPKI